MKKLINFAAGLAVGLACISPAFADEGGLPIFGTSGTALNAGTNYAIIPTVSPLFQSTGMGGYPSITYLNVSGLSASPIALTSYVSTNQTTIVLTNNVGLERTNYVSSTNGFTAGQFVVIQHVAMHPLKRFSCEALIISAVQTTNGVPEIVYGTAPIYPVAVGDIVNGETLSGSIPVATSTTVPLNLLGPGILAGQRNEPLLLVAQSTGGVGTNTINAATAQFLHNHTRLCTIKMAEKPKMATR
jgi:hypothetical protein